MAALPATATQTVKDAAAAAATKAQESATAAQETKNAIETALGAGATDAEKVAASAAASTAKTKADEAKAAAEAVGGLLPIGPAQADKQAADRAAAAATNIFAAAEDRDDAAKQAVTSGESAVGNIERDPDGLLAAAKSARDAAKTDRDGTRSAADASASGARELAAALETFTGITAPAAVGSLYIARFDGEAKHWNFRDATGAIAITEQELDPDPKKGHKVCVATATTTVVAAGQADRQWPGLPLDPRHTTQTGEPDHLLARLGEKPGTLAAARTLPVSVVPGENLQVPSASGEPKLNGIALAQLVFDEIAEIKANAGIPRERKEPFETALKTLAGGNDGQRPSSRR